ncbi:MAG: metal ABC transporter permease [Patescibacteria group bacterium]
MATNELYSLILAILTAGAAGVVGSFALMKKMSLAGDVVAHLALPGLGAALLWKINPLVGAAATLLLGTLLIWQLEKRSSLQTDTSIGVIFTAALAVGALLTPKEELIEALFGGFAKLSLFGFSLGVLGVFAIVATTLALRNRLILNIFSPELAKSAGVSVHLTNLIYLLVFALTILLGLQFLGAILVGALIIVPAAIGRELAKTFPQFLTISAIAGALSVVLGYAISQIYGLDLGPVVVAVSAALFGITLFRKKS